MALGITAKEFLGALYNHFGELSGKSLKYFSKLGEESGTGPLLEKVAGAMNPQKRGIVAGNLMGVDEFVESINKFPDLIRGSKPTAFELSGRVAIPPHEIYGRANNVSAVLTIPHEGRHVEDFYGLISSPLMNRVSLGSAEKVPVFKESLLQGRSNTWKNPGLPIGSTEEWNRAYYGSNYGTAIQKKEGLIKLHEIDAMLSETATGHKAGIIQGDAVMSKSRMARLWENLPDVAKKYYLDTAGVAGLGSASLLKKWSANVVQGELESA